MELRDLFRGLGVGDTVELADEIVNRVDAATGIEIDDELDQIVADRLVAEIEGR